MEISFSCGSTDYHPMEATTINDPCLVTLKLSNDSIGSYLLEATMINEPHLVSSELSNYCWIEKNTHLYWIHWSLPTLLLYLVLVSYIFKLEPRTTQHEHYNNISSRHIIKNQIHNTNCNTISPTRHKIIWSTHQLKPFVQQEKLLTTECCPRTINWRTC